jgi:hypothetical protein
VTLALLGETYPVTPLARPCSREFYKAAHSSGTRRLREIIWIVLHDEEAATARAAAAWFQNPRSGGSAHLCVDDNECYRCLAGGELNARALPTTRPDLTLRPASAAD